MLFLRDGKLVFDIGWVGSMEATSNVSDGEDHYICLGFRTEKQKFFLVVDGKEEATGLHGIKD